MTQTDLLIRKAVDLCLQKAVSEAERKADYHAGPGESFPLGPAGQHLQAAWDLAGHAANPDSVRHKIIAFAREHGLLSHLPKTALAWMRGKFRGMVGKLKKARNEDISQLFDLAYHHEQMEGDESQKRRLVRYAEEHGLQHHLPEEAHGLMHDMMVAHNHDGIENDPETGLHHHVVVKAFNPKAWEGTIVKSWVDGDVVHFEGWNATPRRDGEKDITEPEAFIHPMDSYFARHAPLSIEHNGKSLPIGHLQKAAAVRDGKILKEAVHPSDPADFEHFPGSGTGVWVRGVANEEPGVSALRKGNVGGMSFIANAVEYEPLPGGRHRYLKLDPWIESTIAAYPINPDAVIAVAKAYGLAPTEEEEKETPTMPLSIEEIMAEAAKELEAQKQAENEQAITKADLGSVLTEFKTQLLGEVKNEIASSVGAAVEEVKKAVPAEPSVDRGISAGSKALVDAPKDALTLENKPLEYIIEKASKVESSAEFNEQELALINHVLFQGLVGDLKA